MKTSLLVCSLLVLGWSTVATAAAEVTGTWHWTSHTPNGAIETTLKLESKDGKLAGAYSNQFGDTAISNVSLEGDDIAFDVVRNLGGRKYVVHYRGKIEGDTIKGTIEAPGHDGGKAVRLDWAAQRVPTEKPADTKPKP